MQFRVYLARYLGPTGLIWALVHALVILTGYIFVNAKPVSDSLGEAISSGIGSSLIATGISGLLVYVYMALTDEARRKLSIYSRAGVSNVFDVRSTRIKGEYDERLLRGKKIDIIGFGLSAFREDYTSQFASWSHTKQVRIVLLDPNFPSTTHSYCRQRDTEENNASNRIASDVAAFLTAVNQRTDIRRSNFQVRLMQAMPSINYFRIDDEIFWGPYLIGEQSRNMPTILVERGGHLFDTLRSHFETIWDKHSTEPR